MIGFVHASKLHLGYLSASRRRRKLIYKETHHGFLNDFTALPRPFRIDGSNNNDSCTKYKFPLGEKIELRRRNLMTQLCRSDFISFDKILRKGGQFYWPQGPRDITKVWLVILESGMSLNSRINDYADFSQMFKNKFSFDHSARVDSRAVQGLIFLKKFAWIFYAAA